METKVNDVNMKAEVIEGGMRITSKDPSGKPLGVDRMEAYVSNGDNGEFTVTVKPKPQTT